MSPARSVRDPTAGNAEHPHPGTGDRRERRCSPKRGIVRWPPLGAESVKGERRSREARTKRPAALGLQPERNDQVRDSNRDRPPEQIIADLAVVRDRLARRSNATNSCTSRGTSRSGSCVALDPHSGGVNEECGASPTRPHGDVPQLASSNLRSTEELRFPYW